MAMPRYVFQKLTKKQSGMKNVFMCSIFVNEDSALIDAKIIIIL